MFELIPIRGSGYGQVHLSAYHLKDIDPMSLSKEALLMRDTPYKAGTRRVHRVVLTMEMNESTSNVNCLGKEIRVGACVCRPWRRLYCKLGLIQSRRASVACFGKANVGNRVILAFGRQWAYEIPG